MGNCILTNDEQYLFAQGTYYHTFNKLGAHPFIQDGKQGFYFAIWVPNVKEVSLIGDFNEWVVGKDQLIRSETSDIWQGFFPDISIGQCYKYAIMTLNDQILYKADPYALYAEKPPETASVTYDIDHYQWLDHQWLKERKTINPLSSPLNIYEVHLGSWKKDEHDHYYSYLRLADELIPYVKMMGYTHIELMPVMEHPFDGSWGYQITGYYACSSRFGTPDELMGFIDRCHQENIGVILDWVPGHFCRDAHGLGRFNGNMLYEKSDHAQWGTYIFDYGRPQVKSFLISNAFFWIEKYHIDGFRTDGVTSMLYLNYGIEDPKQKRYNPDGSSENLEAIDFLKTLNREIGIRYPDVIMIAEESSAWPLVTYPPDDGGLGFHLKWDMGWMNDTLKYMQLDFPYRPGNHHLLTFSMMYAFNENFILPLSHDEVVHGKLSLIERMPGDYWRQFAGLRLLILYQMCHPGAKLNFMGNEIAQFIEWRYYDKLEWFLTELDPHKKHQAFVRSINMLYRQEKALWQLDHSWDGFKWIDANNVAQAIIIFQRHGLNASDDLTILINCTPETHERFRIGVTHNSTYQEIFNSDNIDFGGSGLINTQIMISEEIPCHGQPYSITLSVPPLGGVILKQVKE